MSHLAVQSNFQTIHKETRNDKHVSNLNRVKECKFDLLITYYASKEAYSYASMTLPVVESLRILQLMMLPEGANMFSSSTSVSDGGSPLM